MEYVNVRYISKLSTQPQKLIKELYVRAYVQQFVEPCRSYIKKIKILIKVRLFSNILV